MRLLTVLVVVFGPHKVLAQNEPDDFLDDDEPFDEQVDDRGSQRGPGPRQRGPTTPVQTPIRNTSPTQNGNGGPSDEITFHLVDPPKYWQPKKRHHRNQAEDQKDGRLNAQAEANAIKAKADEKQNSKQ